MEQKQDEHKIINHELDDFLNQASWGLLKEIIENISSLRKAVTVGGVRLLEKNKKIIIPIVRRKCREDELILHGLFTSWFNEQKVYYDCLSPFFQSDEHSELLKEHEIDAWQYIISDEYFEKFIDVVRSSDINKFLLLSPIYFTPTQKEHLEQLKIEQSETRQALEQESASESGVKKQADGVFLTRGEWKRHEKELRRSQKKIEKLEKENSRLHNRKRELHRENADLKAKIDEIEANHLGEMNILFGQQEVQKHGIMELEQEVTKITSHLTEKNNRIRNLEKTAACRRDEEEKYFHQILSKLDPENLISGLNAPDDVIELLSTVIRPPTTDDAGRPAEASRTMKDLWNDLAAREKELVHNVLEISVENVAEGNYFVDWESGVDIFMDLKCSLSTRIYLADMLYEILQQYFPQSKEGNYNS